MKHKLWAILPALLTVLCLCFGLSACGGVFDAFWFDAYRLTKGIEYVLDEETDTYIVTGGFVIGDLVIPDTHLGKKVTSIGDHAFLNCYLIKSITIPEGVTSIGENVFEGCIELKSIEVVSGNQTYHSNGNCIIETETGTLIAGCKASIIPNDSSVTSIGESAFYGCIGLTSIEIPDSVTSIESNAFAYCSGLQSIKVALGNQTYHSAGDCLIETASKTLILGCKNSKIPTDGCVTSIRGCAFYGCTGLTSIAIPDSVTSIEEKAFHRCTGLTSVTFAGDSQLISIGNSAFSGCSSLTSIAIPDSVTSIGSGAFDGCNSLERIDVAPNNTNYSSQDGILYYNKNETKYFLHIPSAIKGEVVIPDSMTQIAGRSFEDCASLESVVIGNGVTLIGDGAFGGCSSLKSVVIGNRVTRIGDNVFWGCISLEKINVAKWNQTYHSAGDCLIESARKTLILGCKNSNIPADNSVIRIGDSAFDGCNGLTSIKIPDSVTSIGSDAFRECIGLTSVTFAGDSQLTSIKGGAFSDCSSLENIAIPDSVTSIESNAFCRCSGLTSVTFAGDSQLISIGSDAFLGCSGLKSIIIPDSVTSIGSDAFLLCRSLESVTFEGNSKLASIGSGAFYGCSSLKKVYYGGTKTDWDEISIESNDRLIGATRYYYSATAPDETKWAESNHWWHFNEVTGEVVEWKKS